MPGSDPSRRGLLVGSASVVAVAIAGCVGAPEAETEPADDDEVEDDEAEDGDEAEDDDETEATDEDDTNDEGTADDENDEPAVVIPEELPTDPDEDDVVDLTGTDVVEIETREGADGEPTFVFDPPFVRVDRGTTVRWINTDGVFHTVTSTPSLDRRTGGGEVFDATISSAGDEFEWEADESGRQGYYCSPHAGFMFGAIDVE